MDALSRGGWMDALSRSGWMDALSHHAVGREATKTASIT